ncbi:MAG TPA: transporter [Mycobacterium sp.]|nr:transporter [Mycobacterium sp.]
MNTATMIGSVIFAVLLALLIGLTIFLALRGWRHRAERQAELVGTLPEVPDTVGEPTVAATRGLYVGCTFAPSWNDRVVVDDLGYQTKAVLTRYPEGIMVQRSTARPIWIPDQSILAVRTERGIAGKTIPGRRQGGVLAIRWRLPSGAEIDTGFRADDRDDYARWIDEDDR